LDEKTKTEIDEAPGLFIPFPGTIKQVPARPYRGSDPEWQEFMKIARNKELLKKVKEDLANTVKSVCDRSPGIVPRFGNTTRITRYWLDVDFPPIPPPEFERSGYVPSDGRVTHVLTYHSIEIAGDYIAWTTMPVDASTVTRIRQALWPSAVAQSVWTFSKSLFKGDTNSFAGQLGTQPKSGVSMNEMLEHIKQTYGFGKPDATGKGPHSHRSSANRTVDERGRTDSAEDLGKTSIGDAEVSGKSPSRSHHVDPTVSQTPNAHILNAVVIARNKLQQVWKKVPNYPPRGSILVSGLVELDSPKAYIVVDVMAAWDPKTRAFHKESMKLVLRRLQAKKQGPLGGP
jgi:hypothetical protein